MAATAAGAQQQQPSLRDFQLPPEPTPSAAPQVEGPVDREGPVIIAPQVIPTARPTTTPTSRATPATTQTPSTRASNQPSNGAATPQSRAATQAPAQVRTQSQATPTASLPSSVEQPQQLPPASLPDDDSLQSGQPTSEPALNNTAPPQAELAGAGDSGLLGIAWLWWLVAAALATLATAAYWFLRRRPDTAQIIAPEIRKPVVPGKTASEGETAAAAMTSDEPDLRVEAEAISLGRSFANATLSYSITLSNMGAQALRDVRIEADMTTAHSSLPVDQQLANTTTELPDLARIDMLVSGAAKQARGEFRLPVSQIKLIRQGKAALYVPLLRLRIHADGIEPVVKTFVIGQTQGARGSRLTPFRLDEMAQIYREIGLRPLG